MAIIEVQPLYMHNVELTFGTDDFRKHVSSVTFTPSVSTTTWSGLGDNTYTRTSTPTWTCDITFAQDWKSTNSLSKYLLTNQGSTVPVTFTPEDDETLSFTADVVIVPGAIGGAVNSVAETTVQLGVNGAPEPVTP